MKKLLVILLASLTFTVNAQTVVPIYWPFGIASAQANHIRSVIEQANKDQKKYNFILEHKPGAGGSIAVKAVASHNGIVLTSHTSSFFISPMVQPDNGYNFKDFTPVLIQCVNQPTFITSSKYKSFEEIQKQKFLSVGVAGSFTELQGKQLQKSLPNTEVTIVRFLGTPEARFQVLAKNIDLGVDFPLGAIPLIEANKLNVIGSSGNIIFDKKYPVFSKFGISGFENLVMGSMILTSSNVKTEIITELHNILNYASRAPELNEAYEKDFCKKSDLSLQQSNELYKKWSETWPVKVTELLK
jgi:tripartite-type tricarboxylate transporter receptor subunit TctC